MNKTVCSIKCVGLIALFFIIVTTSSASENIGADAADVRIVGGFQATKGEHPWAVYLSTNSSGRGSYCGGSLIASDWVITAAHCIGTDVIYIVAGVFTKSLATSANAFVVQDKYIHPDYDRTSSDDIALLKLANPVPTSLVDIYAELPSISLDSTFVGPGDPLKVIGWGTTTAGGGGSQSNNLLEVTLEVTTEAACQRAFSGVNFDTQICAGSPDIGKDSCQGDSGGPILFTDDGQDYVAGIVSFGRGCGAEGFPSVYTRTAAFLDWVASVIDDGGGGGTGGGNAVEELTNGDSIPLTASRDEELLFKIDVPAGAQFDAVISGGSGDADLYTRFEAQPTTSTYDCRPYESNSNESCSDTNGAGTYYIMVRAYRSFSGVTLSVNYAEDGDASQTVDNLSASQGNWTRTITVDIPSGVSIFNAEITGSNGDADVYVYHATEPSSTVREAVDTETRCVPLKNASNETCSFSNPTEGTWFIRVHSYATFNDLTLETNYD